MTTVKLLCIVYFFGCSLTALHTETDKIILGGSTPGDKPIKSMLSIDALQPVDFIKWNLQLNTNNSFQLKIIYGESQPNTLGFKGDGQSRDYEGSYSIKISPHEKFTEVYTLKSRDFGEAISLVRLNENVFHILTSQQHLMIGNGGWSYSLNRINPVPAGNILISSIIADEKTLQVVFDGRTPCQGIAAEHPEMKASPSCFKLKWKLILNRDSVTSLPTTCSIRKVIDNKPRDVSGTWTIGRGTKKNPDVIIYRIETDVPGKLMHLLAADDNVLFFVNQDGDPYTGNENFSFMLNRRTKNNTLQDDY